jgi:hypothetical protein
MPLPPERTDGISIELCIKAAAASMRLKIIVIDIPNRGIIGPRTDQHHACRFPLE